MRLALPRSGPPVDAPPLLVVALAIDLVLAGATLVLGALAGLLAWRIGPAWGPWALAGFALLVGAADVAAARLSPSGLAWRRRLGYVAMAAAVWRGGPVEGTAAAVLVVLYMGAVWVALVTGGRALSRAIATATGEDKPE